MDKKKYDLLLVAVVQAQDAEYAQNSLKKSGAAVEQLSSIGGFLGRKNTTLLIGTTAERSARLLDILKETCRQRIEYIAVPLESAPLPLPTPTPISIGGATIFALEVEHYEEV
jgi:uncharacterized protein YaaQ